MVAPDQSLSELDRLRAENEAPRGRAEAAEREPFLTRLRRLGRARSRPRD